MLAVLINIKHYAVAYRLHKPPPQCVTSTHPLLDGFPRHEIVVKKHPDGVKEA